MALWRYVLELPDGSRQENLLAAGNKTAAAQRAQRNADARGARVVEGPDVADAHRGSM